jgi:hypothetical protein
VFEATMKEERRTHGGQERSGPGNDYGRIGHEARP